ncbi:helix-turn-helix domain-containing protein [bacterium]|nr:helix-turn-helix domain-containing protein [bacterium]
MGKPELDPIVKEFMRLIGQERQRRKMSYEQVAKLAGVHRTTISLIERGKFNPTLQMCISISNALDISFSKLITRSEKMTKNKKTTTK